MTPQQFSTALGLTESNGNPNSPLGDHGRALGRFQVHPDWVFDWSNRLGIVPKLSETWDSFVERMVQAFYTHHVGGTLSDVEIAMAFHIGHLVHNYDPDWDSAYADRFTLECGKLNSVPSNS